MKKLAVSYFLAYLRIAAKIQLKKINPVIIGVGGSSGKSSLTQLIAIALGGTYKVRFSQGKNSETGIPLDILGIAVKDFSYIGWLFAALTVLYKLFTNWEKYEIYVVEMGIDSPIEPKNMSYLLKIIKPTIAVITNITLEHSQYFDFLVDATNDNNRKEKILSLTADQEMLLLTSLGKNDRALVNADDEQIALRRKQITAKQLCVSRYKTDCDYTVNKIQIELHTLTVNFTTNNKIYSLIINDMLPEHYAYSFLFAIAIAGIFHIPVEQSIYAISKNFALPPGRCTVFEGINNTTIIDSSYNNATLPPLKDMLTLLKEVGTGHRKLAIIGDMRELGSMSKINHTQAAMSIMKNADRAILIGPLMAEYVHPILSQHHFPHDSYNNFTQAKKNILQIIKKNDIILVKSSQNTLFLERVVEMLLQNPEDEAKLCRRGDFWDRKRKESV